MELNRTELESVHHPEMYGTLAQWRKKNEFFSTFFSLPISVVPVGMRGSRASRKNYDHITLDLRK